MSAWTNQLFHLGTLTTNRVESAHSVLKHMLGSSVLSFDTAWTKIDAMVNIQLGEIKTAFEKSRHRIPHVANDPLFRFIAGEVTLKAIRLIEEERLRCLEIGPNEKLCGCYLRTTHGLPCAHELAGIIARGEGIQLDNIHDFWRIIDMDAYGDFSNKAELGEEEDVLMPYYQMMREQPRDVQLYYASHLQKLVHPESTDLKKPPIRRTRGRLKQNSTKREKSSWEYTDELFSNKQFRHNPYGGKISSSSGSSRGRGRSSSGSLGGRGRSSSGSDKSTSRFGFPFRQDVPTFLIPYVDEWLDVERDGNCGYRTVAHVIYGNQEFWTAVRRDLSTELYERFHIYAQVMGGVEQVNQLLQSLDHSVGIATMEKWMSFPDIGLVIATKYNAVVVSVSIDQSLTYLPLTSNAHNNSPAWTITIGYSRPQQHFFLVCQVFFAFLLNYIVNLHNTYVIFQFLCS